MVCTESNPKTLLRKSKLKIFNFFFQQAILIVQYQNTESEENNLAKIVTLF